MFAPAPMIKFQSFLPDGSVNAGGRIYFYEPGLTVPKDVYRDPFGGEVWNQPVVLNAAGMPDGADGIYMDGPYRVVVADANNQMLYTMDNILGLDDTGGAPSGGGDEYFGRDAGIAGAYSVSVPAVTEYTDGLRVCFFALNANTGAATLRINGLAAKALVKPMDFGVVDLDADDIIQHQAVSAVFDAVRDRFILRQSPAEQSPSAEIKVSADDQTVGNLAEKLVSLAPITLQILNDGGAETFQIGLNPAHNADTVDGYHAGVAANQVLVLDGSGLVPLANIPTQLTGKVAGLLSGTVEEGGTGNLIATYLPGAQRIPVAGTLGELAYTTAFSRGIKRLAVEISSANILTTSEYSVANGVPRLNANAVLDNTHFYGTGTGNTYNIDVYNAARLGGTPAGSYQLTAGRNAANGYCPLDGSVLVPLANIPATLTGKNADQLDGQHGSYYAPISSPAFSGTPTAPVPAVSTNSAQIPTTSWVRSYAVCCRVASTGTLFWGLPAGWSLSKPGTGQYLVTHPSNAAVIPTIDRSASNPYHACHAEYVSATQTRIHTYEVASNNSPSENRYSPTDHGFFFVGVARGF